MPTTVDDVVTVLAQLCPPELAEDWDNTGLLIGRSAAVVTRIITCLTLTPDVADEAIEQRCELVVAHHPVLFRGTKTVIDGDTEGAMLLRLIENGVAVYSPHTSFDSAAQGINQQLAEAFRLRDVQPVRAHRELDDLGSGRWGRRLEPVPLENFLKEIQTTIEAKYLEFVPGNTPQVSLVAVACGSAAEFLDDAIQQGCDTLVTGEARFHSALQARAAGIHLVLLGHYSSERPAVERLAITLGNNFPNLKVFASRKEHDPLKIFNCDTMGSP